MAKYSTEFFGHFFYSPELSYHELIEYETRLKEAVQNILEIQGADFIHFEAEGDSLMAQCVFPGFAEELFHTVCEALASQLENTTECKVLCVEKNLANLLVYTIRNGKWQEAALALPCAGPIEEQLRE